MALAQAGLAPSTPAPSGVHFIAVGGIEAACAELRARRFVVASAALSSPPSGRLRYVVEDAVDGALALRGALPPGVDVGAGVGETVRDQVFRVRALGVKGFALALPRLTSTPGGAVHVDDSELVAAWIDAARKAAVVLLIDERDRDARVLVPRPLSEVAGLAIGQVGPREVEAPQSGEVAKGSAAARSASEADEGVDAMLADAGTTPVPESLTPEPPPPAAEPERAFPRTTLGRIAPVAAPERAAVAVSLPVAPAAVVVPAAPVVPVVAQATPADESETPPPVVALAAAIDPRAPSSAPAPAASGAPSSEAPRRGVMKGKRPRLGMRPSELGAPRAEEPRSEAPDSDVSGSGDAGTPPEGNTVMLHDPLADDFTNVGAADNYAPIGGAPGLALIGMAPAPASPGGLRSRVTRGGFMKPTERPAPPPAPRHEPESEPYEAGPEAARRVANASEWRAHAVELDRARGPKPVAAIEKLFATRYVPLLGAAARGEVDGAVRSVMDGWKSNFEHSYREAFSALRVTGKRPPMVFDAPDIAGRIGRLSGARTVKLFLVDAMRFDVGERVAAHLGERLAGRAVCVERPTLWSALPTTTAMQMSLLARGPEALKDVEPPVDPDAEIARGRAVGMVRRERVGAREVMRLDLIEARLRTAGGAYDERVELLAAEIADSVARYVDTLPARTLLFVFGDHGFRLPASADGRTTGPATYGGVSPEEVLVPAQAWLVGGVH